MTSPILFRWRKAVALGFATLPTGMVVAVDPAPLPDLNSVAPATMPPAPQYIDVYQGNAKVAIVRIGSMPRPVYQPYPVYQQPALPAPILPTPVLPAPVLQEQRPDAPVTDAVVDVLHAVRDGTRKVSTATADYMTKVGERTHASADSRPIVFTSYAIPQPPPQPSPLPSAPWLNPAQPAPALVQAPATTTVPAQPSAAQPTVVVIRESAGESRSAPVAAPEAGLVTISSGTLLGVGVAALGIGFGFVTWRRRAPVVPPPAAAAVAVAPAADGILLMGKYNAGPRKESVEKFEIGPSYHAEQQEKKKVEAEKQEAVVELILMQNLALHAELNPTEPEAEAEAGLPVAQEIEPAASSAPAGVDDSMFAAEPILITETPLPGNA